jgi:hypothetical protein
MDMTSEQLADKYQYSLPYTRQDVIDIYSEGYRQALQDVLKLSNGEVINGVLKGMIEEAKVKELIK